MRNIIALLLYLLVLPMQSQVAETGITVNGKVTNVWETPIPDVNIQIKGTSKGTQTDINGQFILTTDLNKILVFSSIGYGSVEIPISENDKELHVVLLPQTTALDEVILRKKKRKRRKDLLAEYDENQELIKTSTGILDKNRSSSAALIIDGDNLMSVGPDFLYSLKNHHPSMRVVRPPAAPEVEVYLRRISYASLDSTSKKAVFDVDGIIHKTAPTYLSANDIDRVAILERNSAIARYGQDGIGGIIVINTKARNGIDRMGITKRYDHSEMQDSLYALFDKEHNYVPKTPEYMKEFGTVSSAEQAKTLLESDREFFANDPYFLLNLAYYFRERWKDNRMADSLLAEIRHRFTENVPALRSLAYRYESLERPNDALNIFLHLLRIDSTSAQSYYDLGEGYAAIGTYKEASEIYSRYKHLRTQSPTPYDQHGADLGMTIASYNKMPSETEIDWEAIEKETDLKITPTLIVATWNNPNIDIGFQIINPNSVLNSWNSSEAFGQQSKRGYSSTLFLLNNTPKGAWQFNLQYFKSISMEPTFLRISVFFNFGLPEQRRVVHLFRLTEEYEGNQLLSVNTGTNTIGN